MIKNSHNPEGHHNPFSGSKGTAILLKRWILPIGGASSGRVCACSLRSMLVLYHPELITTIGGQHSDTLNHLTQGQK